MKQKHQNWTSLNRWYANAAYQENFKHIRITGTILDHDELLDRAEIMEEEVLRHLKVIKSLQEEYDIQSKYIRRAFFKRMEG